MVFPGKDWRRNTPESMGIDSRAITNALKAIEASGKDIHSMLVIRGGVLVYEHYFAPFTSSTQHSMFSCSKTFTSMLIGIAAGKGLLTLDDKVRSWFKDVPVANPNDNLEAMTIRDLLMMGTGHGEDTFGNMHRAEDGDYPRVFLNQIVDHKPGTHFVYNTGATYMLSAILTRATGKSTIDLANEWIFSKIGIDGAWWETCPKGICLGGTGLHVKPTDMARLGVLIANGGVWNGERIIPEEYILDAQTKHIDNRNPSDPSQDPNWASGYGYQMWRCVFHAFRADGMGGQFIVMMPDKEVVFVFTSALGSDISYPLHVIEDHLLEGIHDAPLPENPESLAILYNEGYKTSDPVAFARPACAWNFDIDVNENPLGITHMTLTDNDLTIGFAETAITMPYLWGAPLQKSFAEQKLPMIRTFAPEGYTLALRGLNRDGMLLRLQTVGTPFTYDIRPAKTEKGIVLAIRDVCGNVDYTVTEKNA